MADKSNGIIYGVAEVKFKEKVIGYIDEQGMQPAGNAPSFMDVHVAQVQDGPVDSIMTNPGSDAFTFNLIQLKAENLVDVIGGTKGAADDSWTPPAVMMGTGPMDIKTHSGHTFTIPNARVSKNGLQNGLNMSNVLAFGFRVDMMKPATGGERYKIVPPADAAPDAGAEA